MALRCFIIMLTVGLGVSFADAGKPSDPRSAHDVIVGTVKKVSPEEATNGNPARVTVEITETLRGNMKGAVMAIWSGREHDVDYGDFKKNPIVIKWAAEKAEKPKVGEAYILYGTLWPQKNNNGRESQHFYTRVGGRLPLTDKNRSQVLEDIKADARQAKLQAEHRAAAAALRLANIKKWRASVTDKELAAAISDADFVALGKVSSQQSFAVSEVLKGRRRSKSSDDQPYYLQLTLSRDVAELVDRESQYLLLLSEKGLMLHPSVLVYQPVGDGVVLADADTIKLAREVTKGLAGKAPPAVLLYPDDPALAVALEKAADGKLTVIRGWIFRIGVEMDKIPKVSSVRPDFYLRVSRSTEDDAAKIRLELARSSETDKLLLDATLVHADKSTLTDRAAQAVAALLTAE